MISADVQLLEPGSEIRLFEVDCTAFGGDVLRFHGHLVPYTEAELQGAQNHTVHHAGSLAWQAGSMLIPAGNGAFLGGPKVIWWQGEEYSGWPVQVEGLDVPGDGSAATPTLTVGNIDRSLSALCLLFDDLLQAKVIIRETFAHYLDARNFPSGNPSADPTQERVQIWYVDQKTAEADEAISWQLSSPADVRGQMIPARQIHGLCHWCLTGGYRGADCGYTGGPVAQEDGTPTDDPARDQCGGLLSDCKARFGEHAELPFGGFPGAALLRR